MWKLPALGGARCARTQSCSSVIFRLINLSLRKCFMGEHLWPCSIWTAALLRLCLARCCRRTRCAVTQQMLQQIPQARNPCSRHLDRTDGSYFLSDQADVTHPPTASTLIPAQDKTGWERLTGDQSGVESQCASEMDFSHNCQNWTYILNKTK